MLRRRQLRRAGRREGQINQFLLTLFAPFSRSVTPKKKNYCLRIAAELAAEQDAAGNVNYRH